jgi:hypothetical protein
MKGGVAVMLSTLLELAELRLRPPCDVLLMLTSDEEAGSRKGMRFLVEEDRELFSGVRHAISGVGAMRTWIGNTPLALIQIAEKQRCVIRATVRGPGGHTASGGASRRLGQLLVGLDESRRPARVTSPATLVVSALAEAFLRQHACGPPTGSGRREDRRRPRVARRPRRIAPAPRRQHGHADGARRRHRDERVPTRLFVDLDVRLVPGCTPEDPLPSWRALSLGSLHMRSAMRMPLLVEGEPGVGKTALAQAWAQATGAELVRLQCCEGIDVAQALYDWDFTRQLLAVRVAEATGEPVDVYGDRFLIRRLLLRALEAEMPTLLLIDEMDRADEQFESFLLELLAAFQVTVPELGTLRAAEAREPGSVPVSQTLNRSPARLSRRGAIVVVTSDGLDRGDIGQLGTEVGRLSRVARRLVWLDPTPERPATSPEPAASARCSVTWTSCWQATPCPGLSP